VTACVARYEGTPLARRSTATCRCPTGQIDEIAEDAISQRVMGDFADALVLIRGHSDDVKYQGAFRLSAHDTVQGR
jgi:hypothetical protein